MLLKELLILSSHFSRPLTCMGGSMNILSALVLKKLLALSEIVALSVKSFSLDATLLMAHGHILFTKTRHDFSR